MPAEHCGYEEYEMPMELDPSTVWINAFLKLRDERILNEKRRIGHVYSLDFRPKKIEEYIAQHLQKTEGYDAKIDPNFKGKEPTFGDIVGTNAKITSIVNSENLNITISPSRLELLPQWAPYLPTRYEGTMFPIDRLGNLFVEYRTLDFRPDKEVPRKHVPTIRHIETEIKKGNLEREWNKLYEEMKRLGLW